MSHRMVFLFAIPVFAGAFTLLAKASQPFVLDVDTHRTYTLPEGVTAEDVGLSSSELEYWNALSPAERAEMLKNDPNNWAARVGGAVAKEIVKQSLAAARETRHQHAEIRRQQMDASRGGREGPHLKVTPDADGLSPLRFDHEGT